MTRDIIIGRTPQDLAAFGSEGCVFLGKQYIKMGRVTSLSNNVYLDVARSHVVFICGKRGGGKSYTMGVIAEGMADLPHEINQNLSFIFLDTMGVYWTMKYTNKKDEELLKAWGLKGKGLDIVIYTPIDYYYKYKDQGIPTDKPFAIKPAELDAADWIMSFDIGSNDPMGILIERVVNQLRKIQDNYSINDMVQIVQQDDRSEQTVKDALENRLRSTENWGVFDVQGTTIEELSAGGQVTVLDVSCYATSPGGWKIKALIVGLIAKKLFVQRMLARKNEEFQQLHSAIDYFSAEDVAKKKQEMPFVWLVLDEAHEFLPRQGSNVATDPLVTIMREGRQPGISLILATQQPGKIHTDVMTQADTVISHRITAKIDIDALGMLMQSYMREGLAAQIDNLPRVNGAALIFDDTNEKMYPIRVRPRFTWHGGESPSAVKIKKVEE
ncbi:ATP-binding protein [Candidatus Woesearchaeota archaeon]|nr:ATP-binding protein [Candidatus Woesearchaeota archaeon]